MGNMLWNGSSGSDESGNAINLPKELGQKKYSTTPKHLDDFKKIQAYMQLAKKENATETYAEMKKSI